MGKGGGESCNGLALHPGGLAINLFAEFMLCKADFHLERMYVLSTYCDKFYIFIFLHFLVFAFVNLARKLY